LLIKYLGWVQRFNVLNIKISTIFFSITPLNIWLSKNIGIFILLCAGVWTKSWGRSDQDEEVVQEEGINTINQNESENEVNRKNKNFALVLEEKVLGNSLI